MLWISTPLTAFEVYMSDETPRDQPVVYFHIPDIEDFAGANKNFRTLSEATTLIIQEMKNHSEQTNRNLEQLARETSDNLNKHAKDLHSILSSQVMAIFLAIIVVGGFGLFLLWMIDMIKNHI